MRKTLFISASIVLVLVLANRGVVYSDSFWGDNGLGGFCKNLQVPEKEILRSTFGDYLSVIERREKLDLNKIRIAEFKHIAPLLQRAIELRWTALDFFTLSEFAVGSPCLMMLDKKSLAAVDRAFDLHGLWMTSTALPSNDNEDLAMEFILLGDGKLIIGYGKETWIRVPDYQIQAHYTRYTSMKIARSETLRGLIEIKTLSKPDGELQAFQARAPVFFAFEMLIEIKSLAIERDGLLVGYRALGGEREERRPKILISQRCGLECPK